MQLCFDQVVDIEMLNLLRDKVDEVCQAVKTWNLGKEEVCKLLFCVVGVCLEVFLVYQVIHFAEGNEHAEPPAE